MNVGGPARQVIELAKGLRSRGFETTIAAGKPRRWEGDLRPAAVAEGLDVADVPGLGPAIDPLADARAFSALTRMIRRVKPDIVHTHTAKAGFLGRLAARAAGVRAVVHTFHGTVFDQYFGRARSRAVAAAERALAKRTDRIVAVSHATADEVEAIGIDAVKIRVIEPVIDLTPYLAVRGRSGRLRARVPEDGVLVGWVGRFVKIKDPLAFVEAAALVAAEKPAVRFVLLGAGPLEAELRARAEALALGDRLSLAGFETDMAAVYADLDILASTSRREGMQVAVLEAMAAGVLPVATAVGGAAELIAEGRSGFLVPPGDPKAMAKQILHALDQPPGDLATQRTVARIRARERFGLERGLDRHATLYREILEEKG